MEDVSDFPFRQVLLKIGRPDVFFTEFVNVNGLVSAGKKYVIHRLEKSVEEKPCIAQLWGNDPEKFVKSALLLKDFDFQEININLGCPVKKVLKVGCGSALIGNYPVVEKIVKDLQNLGLKSPISVKTRLGFEDVDLENWFSFLLKLELGTIFLHGRTARQVFTGDADWDSIQKAVEMKNALCPSTKIIGNGDVKDLDQAKEYVGKYGVDGIMIGREVMKNPWVFSNTKPTKEERISTLLLHMEEMEKFVEKFPKKGWSSIKKFYYGYLREDEELVALRLKLFQTTSLEESKEILNTLRI
jgi:tRNA-dihydrouridine synthase